MVKNYSGMKQKELEMELLEIVKKNYEKGFLLLDHNFDIKRMRDLTKVSDIEEIDDIISIMRHMKGVPNFRKHFLRDTDKMEFKLIQIIDDKAVVVLSFDIFSSITDGIMQMYLTDRLKDKQVPYGSYPIVQVLNGKFIGTLAVMFYNDKPYLDCAEDNDCIRCETVYGTKDIYREAARKLAETKYGIKAS